MPAITVTYSPKVATDWDPQKPLTTTKLNALYDCVEYVKQWLGDSYMAGAAKDHNHDGTNSAAVQVGANYLRNGSFESGTSGWALTPFGGGTIVTDTGNAVDGLYCLAITSTMLANGGGQGQTTEYEVCEAAREYFIAGNIKASAAGVSGKAEIVWFDSSKSQISLSTIYSNTSLPTAATDFSLVATAPANAKFKQLRITGGIPGVGSATGTVYFDALVAGLSLDGVVTNDGIEAASPGTVSGFTLTSFAQTMASSTTVGSTTSGSPVKVNEVTLTRGGTYTVQKVIYTSNATYAVVGQIYKNGVAYGAQTSSASTTGQQFYENLSFNSGDLVQLYIWCGVGGAATAHSSLLALMVSNPLGNGYLSL